MCVVPFPIPQEGLSTAYLSLVNHLGRRGIMYRQAEAGLFVMLDLRRFLENSSTVCKMEAGVVSAGVHGLRAFSSIGLLIGRIRGPRCLLLPEQPRCLFVALRKNLVDPQFLWLSWSPDRLLWRTAGLPVRNASLARWTPDPSFSCNVSFCWTSFFFFLSICAPGGRGEALAADTDANEG